MTETIRYGLIGKSDILLSPRNAAVEATLADGRVVTVQALDVAYLVADAYTEATLPISGLVVGQLARVTDKANDLRLWNGSAWVSVTKLTTTGDLVYMGSGGPTRLPIGTVRQALGVVSGLPAWRDAAFVLDQASGFLEAVNTVAETDLYRVTIAGGTLSAATSALRVRVLGDLLNNTGAAQTVRIRVKIGATTIFDSTTVTVQSAADRRAVALMTDLMVSGARAQTSLVLSDGLADGAASPVAIDLLGHHTAVPDNFSINQDFAVTVQLGSASGQLSARGRGRRIEIVG